MSQAVRRIKSFYKRTTLREKLLTLAFILVVLFLWANSWLRDLSAWNDERAFMANELEFQRQTLERGPEFTKGLQRALERVDPSKTYAAAQLSGRVESLLAQAGLSGQADFASVRTREGEIFNDHNLLLRLDRISIDQLIRFNALLKQDTPYINVQSARISANRRNPEELDARFEINSFDLKAESL
jgi:hypothetical protein